MAEFDFERRKSVHLLIFPYPAQGHSLPLLRLAHRLALRPSLSLTVVTTPKNLPSLSPLLSAHPSSVRPLLLPFPSHPSLPPGVENVRDLGNAGNGPIIAALRSLAGPISDWFRSHPDPPAAIISDFFLGWTFHLAADLGIPRFAFFSSGAFLAAVSDHCWRNTAAVCSMQTTVPFPDLPNAPSFKAEHLPQMFRIYKESEPESEMLKDGMIANTSSFGCIFNSFDAIEGPYMAHLKKKMGHGRVYGVGPLSLLGLDSEPGRSDPTDSDAGLFEWIDRCPDESVLYICFGSQKAMRMDQMEALATGLESSGVRFIWVFNTCPIQAEDGLGPLLDGLGSRVSGRSRIIRGWAPQVEILGHRAVGGFLSHCGWNSIMEAVVGGAALAAWPMEADQYVNARLLVDDLGMAIRVCEGANAVPDPNELSRAIVELMREDNPVRGRAKDMTAEALAAVTPEGGSTKDLDALVKELCNIARPN